MQSGGAGMVQNDVVVGGAAKGPVWFGGEVGEMSDDGALF